MIRAGMKIYADGSDQYALTGPAITDHVGNVLVMAPRALLSQGLKVVSRGGNEVATIGARPSAYCPVEAEPGSAGQLLSWFRPTVAIDASRRPLWSEIADGTSALGSNVSIQLPNGSLAGYICASDCFARMSMPNEIEPWKIHGLLRATSSISSVFLGKSGVAGAAATLESGQLLGLVVGIVNNDALIAPLDRLFEVESLQLASLKNLKDFNATLAVRGPLPEPIKKILDAVHVVSTHGWHAVVANWIVNGWMKHLNGDPRAFFPYDSFFRSPQSFFQLEAKLWDFRWKYLDVVGFDEFDWNAVLRDASYRINPAEESADRTEKHAVSSYDLVTGRHHG